MISSVCVIFGLTVLLQGTESYSNGDFTRSSTVTAACTDMDPTMGHRAGPQTGSSPYSLTVNTPTGGYTPDNIITVTLSGGSTSFEGFMLQARKVNSDTRVGNFEADGTSIAQFKYNCLTLPGLAGSAVSQVSSSAMTSVTFTWIPPRINEGSIEFVYSVVQTKATFWVKQKSAQLSCVNGTDHVAVSWLALTACIITLITSLL